MNGGKERVADVVVAVTKHGYQPLVIEKGVKSDRFGVRYKGVDRGNVAGGLQRGNRF
jgi:hypothetical protein